MEIVDNRQRLGFTAIATTLTAFFDVPNTNGDRVFTHNGELQPNNKYFAHVDAVLDQLEFRSMAVYLVVLWWNQVNTKWYGRGRSRAVKRTKLQFDRYMCAVIVGRHSVLHRPLTPAFVMDAGLGGAGVGAPT